MGAKTGHFSLARAMRKEAPAATLRSLLESIMQEFRKTSLRSRFVRRLAVGALGAGALFCALVAGERPAAAQVVEVAPPAMRVEVIPPAPPHYVWAGGYWGWYGGRYVWIDGCWERERPGWAYERAHWWRGGRGWRFARGHWHRR
jgi:hypothetical protein